MLPLDQYPDRDAIEAAARADGIVKTTEDFNRIGKIIEQEMYTRDLTERVIGYLKTHRSAGRADLYRRFRGDNHRLAFNDAMLRLLGSGHVQIEKVRPEGARGRKIETFIWSDKVLPIKPVLKPISAQQIAPPQEQFVTTNVEDPAETKNAPSLIISDTKITHIDEFRNSEQTCYPANPEGRACKNIGEKKDGSAGNAEGEPTLSGVGSTLSETKVNIETESKMQSNKPSQIPTDKRFDW
jgi:hypothetical protein